MRKIGGWSALALLTLAGCASRLPPPVPPKATAPAPDDGIPKVVKRILAEEKELVARCTELARALPDAQGRARAEREIAELEAELVQIRVDDGEALDDAVARVLAVDRRLTLLHEALATAAARSPLASENGGT